MLLAELMVAVFNQNGLDGLDHRDVDVFISCANDSKTALYKEHSGTLHTFVLDDGSEYKVRESEDGDLKMVN